MNQESHQEHTTLPLGVRGQYQLPSTTLTLREGLTEYYRVNPGLSDPKRIEDPTSATYFRNHDCTHVLFGTHTGDLNEGFNDLLTMFGVDVSLRDYVAGFFATDESASISKSYLSWAVFGTLWNTLKLIPTARRVGRAMSKKWPWSPPDSAFDRPLGELRSEYGIEVIRPEAVLGLNTPVRVATKTDPSQS